MHEKIKVSFTIDKRVWEDFKLFVYRKHKKLHGVLGEEVAKALDEYVSKNVISSKKDTEGVIFRILRAYEDFSNEIEEVLEEFIGFKEVGGVA